MNELPSFLRANIEHVLCVLLFLARLGDAGTTYLVSPTLALEANTVARRLGWWFIGATVLLCLLPYYSVQLAVVLLVMSLLVSAANSSKIWIVRTIGEGEYLAFLHGLARRSKRSEALWGVLASAAFSMLAGAVVLLFYPRPDEDWGFWLGCGIIMYGFAIGIHGVSFVVRLFREANEHAAQPPAA